MQPTLLIASPQMHDQYFERTVVLVWHHGPDGAIGVVVNKPVEHKLEDVLDMEGPLPTRPEVAVVWGGPVESLAGTVVTLGPLNPEEGVRLPRGLAVTHSQDALVRLLSDRAPMMLCLGYAGWSPGQLDREIELGGWLYTDCDPSIVFDTPPEERYDRALATLGLTAGRVWMTPVSE
jgi:putative transcriptional regulator